MGSRHRIAVALTACAMLAGSVQAQEQRQAASESDRVNTAKLVHSLLSDKRYSYYARRVDDAVSDRIFDDYVAALGAEPDAVAAARPSLEQYRMSLDDEIRRGRLDAAYAIADALPPKDGASRSRDEVLQAFLNAYGRQADPGARYYSPFVSSSPAPLIETKANREWSGARQSVLDVGGRRVGVISIGRFDALTGESTASRQVARMLDELAASGVSSLVLDLRGSPGGAFSQAVDMAGLFVGKVPIVQIRETGGRTSVQPSEVAQAWRGSLAVLVDGATMAGSEALAATIQDHGRGPVVGATTPGAAALRNPVDLDRPLKERHYGEVVLTVALMFRLDGRPIEVAGVVPDVVLDSGVTPRAPVDGAVPDPIGPARGYEAPKPLRIARSASPARAANVDAALWETAWLLAGGADAQASARDQAH